MQNIIWKIQEATEEQKLILDHGLSCLEAGKLKKLKKLSGTRPAAAIDIKVKCAPLPESFHG